MNNAVDQKAEKLARNVVQVLLKDKRTSEKLTQTMVDSLCSAGSFDQANRLSQILAKQSPLLSTDQLQQLREAEQQNDQLQGAYKFDDHISSIEARRNATNDAPF